MANKEHLEILNQGVVAWNQWRRSNPLIIPDLSRAVLIEADLIKADLREAVLIEADLSRAVLIKANLSRADLSDADLSDADLSDVDLSRAVLRKAVLNDAVLNDADLSDANLSGAYLIYANLIYANLSDTNLSGADLSYANLRRADLRRADLRRALLIEAGLSEAVLSGAVLSGAVLNEARIGWTIFADNDLSAVRGLETVLHFGPSTIGVDTLFKSQGHIPEIFLRGAGLPDDFITYVRALTSRPIEFYSCFISYSSKDQDFADRLHTDLQSKGVRCWFAPEDLKIGDKTRDTIDESIRLHDKLLLILSEQSVASPWVEHEVEAALERESREKRLVLFPVRLDDAVMDTDKAWAANIRRTRNVGDFRQWKSHDDYQKALNRVFRDLKAATDDT